jgi:hypothetical protein
MKNVLRFGAMLAMAASVAFSPAVSVKAATCLPGLEEADCKLVEGATAAANGLKSLTIDSYTVKLEVIGSPTGDVKVNVNGTGGMDTSAITPEMMSNPTELLKALVFALTADAAIEAPNAPAGGVIEVRIVEGVVYAKIGEQWVKQDVEKALAASGGFDASALMGLANNPAAGASNELLMQIPGAVNGSAEDGPEIAGKATRAITTSIDVSALVNGLLSEDMRPMLAQLMASIPGGQAIDESQLRQLGAAVAMFEPILKATEIRFTQYVGKDDMVPYGLDLKFATVIDPSVGAMFGLQQTLSLNIEFSVRVSNVNGGFTAEVPADAQELPSN